VRLHSFSAVLAGIEIKQVMAGAERAHEVGGAPSL
jgi:hypothetical protein